MTLSRRLLLGAGITTLPALCAAAARPDPLRSALAAYQRDVRCPGLQFAVISNGVLSASGAMGLASVEYNAPVTQDTLFPINSATKSFTGVAIMQLVEQGALELHAPASLYLHDLPTAWRDVSLTHCLSHCSGLPNIVDRDGLIGTGDEKDAWSAVQSMPMEFRPGDRFAYNQTNYFILGRVIERVSGISFADFFATHQFSPCGMRQTRFGDTFDVIGGSAQPYSYLRRVRGGDEIQTSSLNRWTDDMPQSLRAGGGIYTTARELALWISALMAGRLLKRTESVERLWAPPQLNDGRENVYALGWPLLAVGADRCPAGIGGGRAAFVIWPGSRSAIIVLTNLVGANPEARMAQFAAATL